MCISLTVFFFSWPGNGVAAVASALSPSISVSAILKFVVRFRDPEEEEEDSGISGSAEKIHVNHRVQSASPRGPHGRYVKGQFCASTLFYSSFVRRCNV